MRLAAAKDEQAAAEKQKVEREEAAHKILMEQEDILEEIMHESKRLQQEAEENAKVSCHDVGMLICTQINCLINHAVVITLRN